jgi:hypothetical protein
LSLRPLFELTKKYLQKKKVNGAKSKASLLKTDRSFAAAIPEETSVTFAQLKLIRSSSGTQLAHMGLVGTTRQKTAVYKGPKKRIEERMLNTLKAMSVIALVSTLCACTGSSNSQNASPAAPATSSNPSELDHEPSNTASPVPSPSPSASPVATATPASK